MLFRYKITKSCEYFCSTYLVRYKVYIQRYNQNNMLFKWETCADTTLKSITECLNSDYCFDNFENYLPEIAKTIVEYGNVDKMIEEYIKKTIIEDMQIAKDLRNIEKSIDDLVLTDNWNAIEIKENE